ncbi:MAG: dihydroxyacetone kinase phosphoryl donor subunit DhaM [Actinomycetaceae bacterium]|nr:dihydroxyacetone kinase phosphoryl donor subunit DhaM [Actinomycetaceae bacterium]
MAKVSLVIVSHSKKLAEGVAEVAAQMAPEVVIKPAGGTADGGIGTSYDLVDKTVGELLEDGPVVILTDLGSATLTVESVLDFLEDEPAYFADGPLVEGAVAAAVAAQQDKSAEEVVAAATGAGASWGSPNGSAPNASGDDSQVAEGEATLADPDGLHARPAALVARFVSDFDAEVTINEIAADSVLSLMALGARQGETVQIRATGPQAQEAVTALIAKLEEQP